MISVLAALRRSFELSFLASWRVPQWPPPFFAPLWSVLIIRCASFVAASALGVRACPPDRLTPDYLVGSSAVGVSCCLACPIYLASFYSFVFYWCRWWDSNPHVSKTTSVLRTDTLPSRCHRHISSILDNLEMSSDYFKPLITSAASSYSLGESRLIVAPIASLLASSGLS